MAASPIHEIKRGLIVVRIWRKATRRGEGLSVTTLRLFRNGDQWKESTRFSCDDIPFLRLALNDAYIWIFEQAGKKAE